MELAWELGVGGAVLRPAALERLRGVETESITLFLSGLVGSQFESVSVFGRLMPLDSQHHAHLPVLSQMHSVTGALPPDR